MNPTSTPSTQLSPSPPRGWLGRRMEGWRLRHQLPFNFTIHMIGIPLAVAGVVLFIVLWPAWYWGAAAFVLGYFLQWVGHRAEGNDVGEWAAVKRLFGLPYVGVAPRWNPDDPDRL